MSLLALKPGDVVGGDELDVGEVSEAVVAGLQLRFEAATTEREQTQDQAVHWLLPVREPCAIERPHGLGICHLPTP
ncbi:MAG: hypothetical protein JWR32_6629 [Mycobacterium sp.]|jgi:hypothetical protein|nr:hypothetical protein [Mycobacterium sp.]